MATKTLALFKTDHGRRWWKFSENVGAYRNPNLVAESSGHEGGDAFDAAQDDLLLLGYELIDDTWRDEL